MNSQTRRLKGQSEDSDDDSMTGKDDDDDSEFASSNEVIYAKDCASDSSQA